MANNGGGGSTGVVAVPVIFVALVVLAIWRGEAVCLDGNPRPCMSTSLSQRATDSSI